MSIQTNYDKMGKWEIEKAVFLQKVAVDLGMDLSGYGEMGVNPNTGYTYLWLEDYNFTLYMPINCDLKKEDVYALWTDFNDGTEEEMDLKEYTTLNEIEEWAEELQKNVKE